MSRLPDLLRIIGIVAAVEFLLMIGPFPFRAGFDGALMDMALLLAASVPLIYLLVLGKQARRAELIAARESKAQFRALLDNVADGAVFVDGTGHITHVNRMAEELFGFERTELINKPIEVLLPERYRDGHVELRNSYLADPHVVPHGIGREFLARRRDGSEFPFELSLSPIEGPGEARVLALVADISERRMAGHQRLLLSMAVDNIAESVVITDTDGIVEYVNPAFQRMTGYSREEAVGANANILNSGEHEDAFFEEIWAKLKAGETCTTRFINRRKDGSLYEQETTISPVRDVAGMLTHYVSAGRELA